MGITIKRKIISIISVVLFLIGGMSTFLGLLAGCKKDDEQLEPPVSLTDIVFFNNGYSDYCIVTTADGSGGSAADEINTFFSEATGLRLQVLTDSGLSLSEGKYISLGNTALLKQSKIVVPDDLGSNGYIIKRVGDDIFLTGSINGYSGTLNAAYEFLNGLLGFKYYAPGAYTLKQDVNQLFLPDYDIKRVPDIESRCLGYRSLMEDPLYTSRMRLEQYNSPSTWITVGHSQTDIISPSRYGTSKPDWFNGSNLNYQNDEMTQFMISELKARIANAPNGYIVQLGQADINEIGSKNGLMREKKFMNSAGEQIDWVNRIAEALEPWIEENYPGREIVFSIFAYEYSEAPPAVFNGITQKWEPFVCQETEERPQDADENWEPRWVAGETYVKPRDNVGVYWAPIGMDFSKTIDDPNSADNIKSMQYLKAWADILDKKNLFLWTYSANFSHFFVNQNSFGIYATNYKIFNDYGIRYIFDQGPHSTITGTFEELRVFLQSQLMWNTSADPDALTKEFFENYYKQAASKVEEYYRDLRSWYGYLTETNSGFVSSFDANIVNIDYWPKGVLDGFNRTFNEAFELAGNDVQLINRLKRLYMPTQFLLLSYYRPYYTGQQLKEMIDEFEYYVNYYAMFLKGGKTQIQESINEWRSGL